MDDGIGIASHNDIIRTVYCLHFILNLFSAILVKGSNVNCKLLSDPDSD